MNRRANMVDAETRNELYDLIVAFTWKLDHGEPEGIADLFEPDARFETPQRTFEGADEVEQFFRDRSTSSMSTRSSLTNHRLVRLSDTVIEGKVLITLFLNDGPPGKPDPFQVAEYHDVYARGDDGLWRFRDRRAIHVFVRGTH